MNTEPVELIPVRKIKPFISRAREKEGWEGLRDTMKEVGLKYPVKVRDVRELPASERRGTDGKLYDWQLVYGEGRVLAALDLGWRTIPAIVTAAPEEDSVDEFLLENMVRRRRKWADIGRNIRDAMKEDGASLAEVAKDYHLSEGLAARYARILDRASTAGLEDEITALSANDAELITGLSTDGQSFVIQVAHETETPIPEVAAKAKELEDKGKGWTKAELRKSIVRVGDDLKNVQQRLTAIRLHYALGPQNLMRLLANDDFRAALKRAKINTETFEEVMTNEE